MKLSVIIPVFNEENTILEVIKRLLNTRFPKVDREIIIVDDGSTDSTREKLKKVKSQEIKIIYHKKNQGKGAAVITGIDNSKGDYVIIQDADLEYHPRYINSLLEPILKKMPKLSTEQDLIGCLT
jgi:glycosyltransferase involved in cell wall biosynthesis